MIRLRTGNISGFSCSQSWKHSHARTFDRAFTRARLESVALATDRQMEMESAILDELMILDEEEERGAVTRKISGFLDSGGVPIVSDGGV